MTIPILFNSLNYTSLRKCRMGFEKFMNLFNDFSLFHSISLHSQNFIISFFSVYEPLNLSILLVSSLGIRMLKLSLNVYTLI